MRHRQVADYKSRRQVPIGKYIADFVCYEVKIIIEVDGSQHDGSCYDIERTQWLNSQGFQVYRFWNNEVLTNIDGVMEVIYRAVDKASFPHPNLPPERGRGRGALNFFGIYKQSATTRSCRTRSFTSPAGY